MPTVSFTVSDAALAELIAAVTQRFNYQTTVPDANGDPIPNPESPAQFTRRKLIEWMRDRIIEYRRYVAMSGVSTTDPDIT